MFVQLKHAMNSVGDEVHRFAAPTQSRTRWGDANSDRNAHDGGDAMERCVKFGFSTRGGEETVQIVARQGLAFICMNTI